MDSDLLFSSIGITGANETVPYINPLQYNGKSAAYIKPALRLKILYLPAMCVSVFCTIVRASSNYYASYY
jgi:hypothetical protein